MRFIFILAAVCIAGVYSSKRSDINIAKCGEKCHVELSNENFQKIRGDKVFITSDKGYCLTDCWLQQAKVAEGNNQTYYEEYMELLEKTNKKKFENRTFTREELENLLNKCKSKEFQDVEFLKCIKFAEHPWVTFMLDFVQ